MEPERIDSYELLDVLGGGGMGEVHRVRDRRTGRELAMKLIRPEEVDDDALARFVREIEALSRTQHPGVVKIQAVGQTPRGHPYYVMDLLEGEPLDVHIRRVRRLAPVDAAAVAADLAEAIAHFHAANVFHRDLKPGNVLMVAGRPVIIDFGLASFADSAEALTRTGQLLGSPHYMAPEQANGKTITAAADVWALGAVLYHLLVGRPPFDAYPTLPALLLAIQLEPPPPPSKLAPGIPQSLDRLCLRLLAKNPAERGTAAAVAVELRAIVRLLRLEARAAESGAPSTGTTAEDSRRPSPSPVAAPIAAPAAEPTPPPAAAPRRVAVAALGLGLAVGAGAALAWSQASARAERARVDAERSTERTSAEAALRAAEVAHAVKARHAALEAVLPERTDHGRRAAKAALAAQDACDRLEKRQGATSPLERHDAQSLALARAVLAGTPNEGLAFLADAGRADGNGLLEAELALEAGDADRATAALARLSEGARSLDRTREAVLRTHVALAERERARLVESPEAAARLLDHVRAATSAASNDRLLALVAPVAAAALDAEARRLATSVDLVLEGEAAPESLRGARARIAALALTPSLAALARSSGVDGLAARAERLAAPRTTPSPDTRSRRELVDDAALGFLAWDGSGAALLERVLDHLGEPDALDREAAVRLVGHQAKGGGSGGAARARALQASLASLPGATGSAELELALGWVAFIPRRGPGGAPESDLDGAIAHAANAESAARDRGGLAAAAWRVKAWAKLLKAKRALKEAFDTRRAVQAVLTEAQLVVAELAERVRTPRRGPEAAVLLVALGQLELLLDQRAEAAADLRRALELVPASETPFRETIKRELAAAEADAPR